MTDGISVADALALRNSSGDGGNCGFGGEGWWILVLILLFGAGFGNNGFGGNNYNACCVPATQQGMTDSFNFKQLDDGIRNTQNGICDGFYATNNSIKEILIALQNCCCQTQLATANLGYQIGQGFCGVDKTIMQNGYQNQVGFNTLGNLISSVGCDLGRGQENIKYEMSKFANDLIIAGDKNADRIINYLTQTEMDRLRATVEDYRSQLQFQNLVKQIIPTPKPAYLTCSPYASAFGIGYANANANYGCGATCC